MACLLVLTITSSVASAQGAGGPAPAAPAEAVPPIAAPAPPLVNPALVLRDELMYLKLNQGWSPVMVLQNGHPLQIGMLGGGVERYFSDVPPALEEARGYRSLRTVGFALWLTGLGLLVADLGWELVTLAQKDQSVLTTNLVPWGAILVGGAVLGGVGGAIFSSAPTRLARAVNIRNATILNRFLSPDQQVDLNLFALRGGAGVGLRMTF